ncbi:MAG: hypothetical protein A2162_08450 [Deltaproteobacteria bacterium RBG_13_52_11b]|nr:MAG: hypothetical protein A2162_08450 [Deltaproteobacteria bacterium RBG_13_52_11b]
MRRKSFVYSATKGISQAVFSLLYQIETTKECPSPLDGPAIILPKHQYWTDIPIISLVFEPVLYFVAKKELFDYPFFRDYLLLLGGIPVDREQTVRTLNSFRHLLSLLGAGEKVVIFPEGTYFREGVGSGKSRLIQMVLRSQSALERKIPFLPVGIRYGERVGWRRKVAVSVGPPLFAEAPSDAILFTQKIIEEISRLSQLPLLSS